MELSGIWGGKILDVNGFSGELGLILEQSQDRLQGQITLRVSDQEEAVCMSVPLSGKLSNGTVALSYEETTHTSIPLRFTFQGRVTDVSPLSSCCMYGTYGIHGDRERAFVGDGCCLFWLYQK